MLCLLIVDVFDDMHIWIPLLHVCKVDAKGVDEGMIEKNCFSVSLGVKYTRKMNITTQQWPEENYKVMRKGESLSKIILLAVESVSKYVGKIDGRGNYHK